MLSLDMILTYLNAANVYTIYSPSSHLIAYLVPVCYVFFKLQLTRILEVTSSETSVWSSCFTYSSCGVYWRAVITVVYMRSVDFRRSDEGRNNLEIKQEGKRFPRTCVRVIGRLCFPPTHFDFVLFVAAGILSRPTRFLIADQIFRDI